MPRGKGPQPTRQKRSERRDPKAIHAVAGGMKARLPGGKVVSWNQAMRWQKGQR